MTTQEMARELARIDLPLSTYTQWYRKIDLHNLQHDVCGSRMSRMELEVLRTLISPSGDALTASGQKLERPALDALGLSKREQDELLAKLWPADTS